MKQCSNLFPNKEAFIIFALYIILFVFQGKIILDLNNYKKMSKSIKNKYVLLYLFWAI